MKKIKFALNEETGCLTEEGAKRYFSTVGLATFLFTVVYFLGGILLGFGIEYFAPFLREPGTVYRLVYNLLSQIPLYGMAFPVFFLVLRKLPKDHPTPEKMGGAGFLKGIFVCLFVMMAGNYVSQLILGFFQLVSGRTLTNPVEEVTSAQSFWINLLFIAVLAPILEELVFRKFLCNRLLPLGDGYAVVLSAAIFGLVHGNFFQFFYAFLLGLIFALIYIKTGRIRYTILYHGILNFLGGVVAPWILKRIEPLLNEETLKRMEELSQQGTVEALREMVSAFLIPMIPLLIYELVVLGGSVCGMVFLIIGYKKIRLEKGLLPPPEKGRVANVFLNGGVAAALAAFAAIFVLSLLG